MKRTQLYLEDDIWKLLNALAREQRTTVSDLVRIAVRERYVGSLDERKKAMKAIVGMRANRADMNDPENYIRSLRRGVRTERIERD